MLLSIFVWKMKSTMIIKKGITYRHLLDMLHLAHLTWLTQVLCTHSILPRTLAAVQDSLFQHLTLHLLYSEFISDQVQLNPNGQPLKIPFLVATPF